MNKTRLIAISIALAQLWMASGNPALASNAENDKPLVVGTVDNALPCVTHKKTPLMAGCVRGFSNHFR